jgi:predicted P-loop ATPase
MNLIEQLHTLPSEWGYVAVGHAKRPYQPKWQDNPLTQQQLTAEIDAGRAHAIGVIAGPQSGGLLFVDHDGISAGEVLESIGTPSRDLPKSWAVTSGRNGRFQIIYTVPVQYWNQIKTRKIKSGKYDEDGNVEQLELRWTGCQSVVAGSHPITGSYRWLKGRAPTDLPLAEAPLALIEQMLQLPTPEPTPLLPAPISRRTDRTDKDWALIYLDALNPLRANDYDEWIEVGQCLQSVDDSLFSEWDNWSKQSPKWEAKACDTHWKSFKPGGNRSIKRLCNLAKLDGWRPKEKLSRSKPTEQGFLPSDASLPAKEKDGDEFKLEKLEANKLLDMLRPKGNEESKFRYNIFTQQIEIQGQVAKNIEHFYLQLSEMGYKISKDIALDCLVKVAHENSYDPVRLYLEHVEAQVEPTYIDRLASTYLRPADAAETAPTLYDHMIKRTLIAAVRRIFQPGCKHDHACVLMGDQGARKSSFWSAIGGPFFSDALRDISSKDDLMVLHRSWIMEWAELDAIVSKKHAGQIKGFLSQSTDLFRVPYGKATEAFPRRGIIVGSTNRDSGFLVDETGNRRFWVIPVTCTLQNPIDVPNLLIERDAIWAAAVAAYRAGETSILTIDQESQVQTENTTYLVESPWVAPIDAWLRAPHNRPKVITTGLLLAEAIQKPIERQTRSDQMQVGNILRDLGYVRKRTTVDGCLKWVFFLPSENR